MKSKSRKASKQTGDRPQRSRKASTPAPRRPNRVLNVVLALIIAGGVVYLIVDRPVETGWSSAAAPASPELLPPQSSKLGDPKYFTEPPAPTYSASDDGVRIAHLDTKLLTEWCRLYALPDSPVLTYTEPAVADSLVSALREAVRKPGSETFGQLGMICESLDCHESASEYFRRAAASDPKDFRWPYYLACIEQVVGRNQRAIETFLKVIDLNPEYAMTYARLGQLYLELDGLDEAARHLERYVALSPQDSLGYVGLARVALKRNDFAEALEYALQGLQYGSNDFQVHYTLARAYAGLGQDQRAQKHFDICGKLPKGMWFALRDPLDQELQASANSVNVLARKMERMQHSQDWSELAKLAEQISQRRPGDTLMMTNLASLYRKMRRFDDAHHALDRAESIDPELLVVHVTRAEVLLAEGRYPDAVQAADEAIRRDPKSHRAFNVRGRALLLLKRFDHAVEAMRKCVELQPDHAGNTLVLAEALRGAGQFEQAAEYYQRVLLLAPGHPQAGQRLAELENLDRPQGE